MRTTGIAYVNINCSDYDRSLAFYVSLGFRVEQTFAEGCYPQAAEGFQVGRHRLRAALLAIGDDVAASRVDLIEWMEPRLAPAPSPLNAPGFQRLALATRDFEGDLGRLRDLGVDFLSEPMTVQGPDGATPVFVCFRDPDGNVLELVPCEAIPPRGEAP